MRALLESVERTSNPPWSGPGVALIVDARNHEDPAIWLEAVVERLERHSVLEENAPEAEPDS